MTLIVLSSSDTYSLYSLISNLMSSVFSSRSFKWVLSKTFPHSNSLHFPCSSQIVHSLSSLQSHRFRCPNSASYNRRKWRTELTFLGSKCVPCDSFSDTDNLYSALRVKYHVSHRYKEIDSTVMSLYIMGDEIL